MKPDGSMEIMDVIPNHMGIAAGCNPWWNDVLGVAYRVLYLLSNPEAAARIGRIAREHVRRNFLITRHLADYLMLLSVTAPR